MPVDDPLGAPTRARIQALAALGVPLDDIRQLHGTMPDGTLLTAADFKAQCARELGAGYAQANIEVSKALFEQAVSGKHSTVTLAWAKQKLGWNDTPEEAPDHAALAASASALAALQQLLDQLAAAKAGGATGASALAHGGASGTTATPP